MKLKILVVADHESRYIWDFFDKSVFQGIDLILSCGDLKAEYLSFLVTMIPAPLLYVRGNHDGSYDEQPPEGCIDLESKPFCFRGIRFFGFGGCKSRMKKRNHYTESDMYRRVNRRIPAIFAGGMDVLVTHAPALGLGDGDDRFHEGFLVFRKLIERFSPRYFVHGHQHMSYSYKTKRMMTYRNTTIINACNYYILNMEFPDRKERT
ncbi:MAG: metallophosphoesterase family protein [Christensenellales bacterium]|jgi:Icc-related predicted phosphoesterase